MPEPKNPAAQLPPEIARYLRGAPPESRQFDFLIGDWDVAATRYKEDGSPLMHYKASWSAKHLNEGRMVIDDFKAHLPTGQDISSFVTLRTYSEATQRWELAGLPALQPAAIAQWRGAWKDGEMLLDAIGKDMAGASIQNKIRFFNITKDSFDWVSNNSHDNGKTWIKFASLRASRVRR
jgi:hypothetical protein